eukprot:Gb_30758 [translate_table: standard]
MAENNINEITIAGGDEGESSNTTVEIKIKTLDSQTYTLRVNKCMSVPALKEQIATVTGVLSEQQRLICRGKVLKDDQLLSAYHVEDGHTLHLVVRQPLQTPAGASGNDGNVEHQGADPTSGATRNRSGQVSHSVVLGTFNIPDQGDGGIPDLNRIISAVLNSVGIGNIVPVNAGAGNGSAMMPQGTSLEGQERVGNASGRSDTNQLQPDQPISDVQFEPVPGSFRSPPASLLRPFSQATVIPDSLTTISQYLNRMRQEMALNVSGNQAQTATSNEAENYGNATGLPSVPRGLPTPAALGAVIRRTQELLVNQAGASLSQLARQLEGEATVTDVMARDEIQSGALRNGIIMQNLGALLLELGRTTMTLRMGHSSAESIVNAGPAVFVSTSGPNPLMVQPLPFQPGSSFGAIPIGATHPSAGVTGGTVGTGDVLRNIDIHIRAGRSLAPGANTEQAENVSGQQVVGQANQVGITQGGNYGRQGVSSILGETGTVRVVPVRTVVAAVPATINARPPTEAGGSALGVFYPLLARFQQLNPSQLTQMRSSPQAHVGGHSRSADTAQQQSPASVHLPTIRAQVQLHASTPSTAQNVGGQEETRPLDSFTTTSSAETRPSICERPQNQAVSSTEQASARQGPSNVHVYNVDVGIGNMQRNNDQANLGLAGSENSSAVHLPNGLGQIFNSLVSGGQVGSVRVDVEDIMSQLTHNPAISNVSRPAVEQTIQVSASGSNMMDQAMQNTFSQGEQTAGGSRELRDMFSGLNGTRQGGIDFSGLLQQMMPVVSQVLGRESEAPASDHVAEAQPRNQERISAENNGAEIPKPQDEAENGNGNSSINSERQQSEHSDDVYPGVSPASKRQKTQ